MQRYAVNAFKTAAKRQNERNQQTRQRYRTQPNRQEMQRCMRGMRCETHAAGSGNAGRQRGSSAAVHQPRVWQCGARRQVRVHAGRQRGRGERYARAMRAFARACGRKQTRATRTKETRACTRAGEVKCKAQHVRARQCGACGSATRGARRVAAVTQTVRARAVARHGQAKCVQQAVAVCR